MDDSSSSFPSARQEISSAPRRAKGRHRVTVQKHPAFDGLKASLVLAVPTHRIQLKPIASQSSIMKGLAGHRVLRRREIGYEMLQLFGVPMLEIKALQ